MTARKTRSERNLRQPGSGLKLGQPLEKRGPTPARNRSQPARSLYDRYPPGAREALLARLGATVQLPGEGGPGKLGDGAGLPEEAARSLAESLRAVNLPADDLIPAILAELRALSPEAARRAAGAAVARALNEPNRLGATRVPVKEPQGAENAVLIEHYLAAGALSRGADGKLYALFRNPLVPGTMPEHNRCLGVDVPGQGSYMAKGTGLCTPRDFRLGEGDECAVKVVLLRDRSARKDYHQHQGALTARQAADNVSPYYRKLAASLRSALADQALAPLAKKHVIGEEMIPGKVLTLEIEAIPVAPGKGASALARRIKSPVQVDAQLAKQSPELVWVEAREYRKVFDAGEPGTPSARRGERDQPYTVQLYASAHPALRLGGMDLTNQRAETLAAPALSWDAKLGWAEAAVATGWWERIFNDYGWTLRHEPTGKIRVHDRATGQPLREGGDSRAGSMAAARTVAEGTAVKNGLFLRALWSADLAASAFPGGQPTSLRNSNPRCVLDLDTIGPFDTPRERRSFADPGDRVLTREESRREDLAPPSGAASAPRYQLSTVLRLLGVFEETEDLERLDRLMLEVATSYSLPGQTLR